MIATATNLLILLAYMPWAPAPTFHPTSVASSGGENQPVPSPESEQEKVAARDEKARAKLESVRDRLIENWKQVKTLRMTIDIEVRSKLFGGQEDISEGGGVIEINRTRTPRRVRAESRLNPVDTGGETYRHRPSMLQAVIEDGEAVYTIRQVGPGSAAYKHDLGTPYFPEFAPDVIFDQLGPTMEMMVDGESEILDRPVVIVKAVAEEGVPVYSFFFDKASGVALKVVMDDPVRQTMFSTFTCIELKLNVPIDDDRFKVEIPDGLELIDQTTKKSAADNKDGDQESESP